jgi:hypothetical protein
VNALLIPIPKIIPDQTLLSKQEHANQIRLDERYQPAEKKARCQQTNKQTNNIHKEE